MIGWKKLLLVGGEADAALVHWLGEVAVEPLAERNREHATRCQIHEIVESNIANFNQLEVGQCLTDLRKTPHLVRRSIGRVDNQLLLLRKRRCRIGTEIRICRE